MRITPLHRLIILSCIVAAILGCGKAPAPETVAPEKLTLYSIDGRDFPLGKAPEAKEKFHDFPVLGKTDISDAAQRQEIIAALRDGISSSDGTMAKCFWPRHGIRMVVKGRTIDYVICFECYQLKVFDGGTATKKPVTRKPQDVFDKPLKAAGIPLTPRPTNGKE